MLLIVTAQDELNGGAKLPGEDSNAATMMALYSISNTLGLQEFMSVKDRYIRSIGSLIESAAQRPNSPAGLRAQQLAREAVVLTFYACFLSPRKLCRASAFNYATKEASGSDDPSLWAAVMVSFPGKLAFAF